MVVHPLKIFPIYEAIALISIMYLCMFLLQSKIWISNIGHLAHPLIRYLTIEKLDISHPLKRCLIWFFRYDASSKTVFNIDIWVCRIL